MAVALVGTTMATLPVSAEVQDSYTFSLVGTVGTAQFWDSAAPTVQVTGDGSYSLQFDIEQPTEAKDGTGAIIISTDINAFDFDDEGNIENTGIKIAVDSVEVDGNPIEYKGPSAGAYALNDDGKTIRLNIYNVWGNDVPDIDFNFTVENSVKVNFTVDGLTDAIANAKGSTGDTTTTDDQPTIGDSDNGGKNPTIGDSDNGKDSGKDSGKTTSTTTATTTAKASSPNTGDTGMGSILMALGLASITAFALKKRD